MVYVDSNVFIYPVIYDPKLIKKSASAKERLLEIVRGKAEAYTSCLTWDEVTWVTRRIFGAETSVTQGASLLRLPNLKFLSVDNDVILMAQEILQTHSLRPRDSIHAATALRNKVTDILSDDPDFDKIPKLRRLPLSTQLS